MRISLLLLKRYNPRKSFSSWIAVSRCSSRLFRFIARFASSGLSIIFWQLPKSFSLIYRITHSKRSQTLRSFMQVTPHKNIVCALNLTFKHWIAFAVGSNWKFHERTFELKRLYTQINAVSFCLYLSLQQRDIDRHTSLNITLFVQGTFPMSTATAKVSACFL